MVARRQAECISIVLYFPSILVFLEGLKRQTKQKQPNADLWFVNKQLGLSPTVNVMQRRQKRDKERAKYILASLVSLGDWHMLCFQQWLTECSGIPEMSSVLNRQSHRSCLLYRVDLLPDLIQIFSSTRFSRFLLELTSYLHFNTGARKPACTALCTS